MEYGKNWRIKIKTADSNFVNIGGEGSFDWKTASDKVDLSSKDDGKIKATGWGQQEVSFAIQGKVKLPDVGLEKAKEISDLDTPEVEIQVVRGTAIVWQGMVGIGNFSMSFPKDGAATYSFDMSAVAAPTIDDLTPAPVAP